MLGGALHYSGRNIMTELEFQGAVLDVCTLKQWIWWAWSSDENAWPGFCICACEGLKRCATCVEVLQTLWMRSSRVLQFSHRLWTCNMRMCPKCWILKVEKKWYNYGPLDFGLYPFLDNSRMPEDCHPTWKIGGLWRGLAGSLAGLFASWLQWFKVPCFFKRAVMRSGTSGTWPLGTWDPPGAHYVPLVCRPGTDSGTFPPKILCQFESRWVFETYVLTCRLPSCIKTALWWLPICWTTVLNHCAILLGENHRSFNAVARSWNRQGQSVITAH